LRWLLGLGDNVEVVAPSGLRLAMREQMAKAVRHYEAVDGLGVAAG
jgi:predicted DNA-binding transcriptional regulator YafY